MLGRHPVRGRFVLGRAFGRWYVCAFVCLVCCVYVCLSVCLGIMLCHLLVVIPGTLAVEGHAKCTTNLLQPCIEEFYHSDIADSGYLFCLESHGYHWQTVFRIYFHQGTAHYQYYIMGIMSRSIMYYTCIIMYALRHHRSRALLACVIWYS